MVSTTTTANAILTPEQVAQLVILPLSQTSVAMQVGTVVTINSHVLRVPRVVSDPSASFVAEGQEIPATDAAFDQLDITPAKLAALSVITSELAADSSPRALQIVGDGIVRDVAKKLDAAFLGTSTSNGPAGIGSIAPTAADAGDSWSNLDAFEFARTTAEQHSTVVDSFVGNPATVLKIATLKESGLATSNKALLQPDPAKPSGRTVACVPLYTSPAVPNDVIWGIPRNRVVIALRQGATVESDKSVFFTSDKVALRCTLRVSWGVHRPGLDHEDRNHAVTKRTVQSGMITYTDPDGVQRYGVAGDEVDVHADHLKRFDELNGGAPEKPAPKKQPARKA